MGWILFDRKVTSQTYFPPPKPYIRPTVSSPLSPFYGPDYVTFTNGPVRIFPSKSFPCSQLIPEKTFGNPGPMTWKDGFLFVLSPYSAGTTLASITTRIARNVAKRRFQNEEKGSISHNTSNNNSNHTACVTWNTRTRGNRLRLRNRDTSILWSMVREPVDRMITRYFHQVISMEGHENTMETFTKFIEKNAYSEYGKLIRTLTMRNMNGHLYPNKNYDIMQQYIHEILNAYDFLGVMERFDESLATFQLLFGLETQDMIYLTTKTSPNPTTIENNHGQVEDTTASRRLGGGGGEAGIGIGGDGRFFTTFINHKKGETTCIQLQPKTIPLSMKEYLHQPYLFEEIFELDIYLYKAINQSLDATIEQIGRDQVDLAVKRLRWGQEKINKQQDDTCWKTITFPCSQHGMKPIVSSDCITGEIGCGIQCIDEIGTLMTNDPDFLKL